MENRRQDYRHPFPGPPRLRVTLSSNTRASKLVGEIVNLSVWGMALQVDGPVSLASASQWTLDFSLPSEPTSLKVQATLVYQSSDNLRFGFQFHPLAETQANEDREKLIWRFLLNEQRRGRTQN